MVALAAERGSGFSIPRMRTKIMTTRIRESTSKNMIIKIPCEFKVVYTIFLFLSIGKLHKNNPHFLCNVTKGRNKSLV
jgi:hypothetical protein